MPWEPPAPKLREVIAAIRAVWTSWSEDRPLNFRGRFFTLSLMTPFFSPPGPRPPGLRIEIAGVGAQMCRLAGETADGFHVHPFHTRRYLRDVVMPHIEEGLARSGRPRRDLSVAASVFAAIGSGAEVAAGLKDIRRNLSFYASTPSYRPVLDVHGWGESGAQLSRLASRGRWDEMPRLISDEMLEACAVWGTPDEVAARLRAEYGGIADRLAIYEPLVPGRRARVWQAMLEGLRAGT
jgi:probable F420-dependent oxidoreductase